MTYYVSSGTLNPTHSLALGVWAELKNAVSWLRPWGSDRWDCHLFRIYCSQVTHTYLKPLLTC